MITVNVLYKKGPDLILFDFDYKEITEAVSELIEFHFCERHDFEERTENCAKSIFKDFYRYQDDGEPELIDYVEIINE